MTEEELEKLFEDAFSCRSIVFGVLSDEIDIEGKVMDGVEIQGYKEDIDRSIWFNVDYNEDDAVRLVDERGVDEYLGKLLAAIAEKHGFATAKKYSLEIDPRKVKEFVIALIDYYNKKVEQSD